MTERDYSEYDVVSFKVRAGTLSILCAVFPIVFGFLADDLPFIMDGRLRPYYGYIFLAALGFCVVGMAVGGYSVKRREKGGAGRLGVLVNGVVFVLLSLFLLIFRWIRWGNLSWF